MKSVVPSITLCHQSRVQTDPLSVEDHSVDLGGVGLRRAMVRDDLRGLAPWGQCSEAYGLGFPSPLHEARDVLGSAFTRGGMSPP